MGENSYDIQMSRREAFSEGGILHTYPLHVPIVGIRVTQYASDLFSTLPPFLDPQAALEKVPIGLIGSRGPDTHPSTHVDQQQLLTTCRTRNKLWTKHNEPFVLQEEPCREAERCHTEPKHHQWQDWA
jgi:hypothetical protein